MYIMLAIHNDIILKINVQSKSSNFSFYSVSFWFWMLYFQNLLKNKFGTQIICCSSITICMGILSGILKIQSIFLSSLNQFFLVEIHMHCWPSFLPEAMNSSFKSSCALLENNVLHVCKVIMKCLCFVECFLSRGLQLAEWPPNQMGYGKFPHFYVLFTACKHLFRVL